MEVEAGMNMENMAILGKASLKLLSFWWPIIVIGIVGIFWADRKVDQLKEGK